jgi:proline-specific peptidase
VAETSEQLVRLADGYERFVTRSGDGPAVLLCQHGGPGDSLEALLPLRTIAGEGLEVVLYDQLGGGRSDNPGRRELWTVETFVSEFAELTDALDLGGVHLLGQSWGGMLALECALAHPDKVKSLILCDTMASIQAALDGFAAVLARASAEARAAVAAGHAFDPDDGSVWGSALLDLYATHVRRCYPFDLERSRREFIEVIVRPLGEPGPAYEAMWGPSEFSPSGNLVGWDVTERLGEIQVPALVACGAYDELTPEQCHRPLVEGLRDVRWLILGQSSHAIFHEHEADLLLSAIRDFVTGVAPVVAPNQSPSDHRS